MTEQEGNQHHRELLRRWEPILEFAASTSPDNKNERFLPMPVGPFVEASSLWVEYRLLGLFTLKRIQFKAAGKLSLETLPKSPPPIHPIWDTVRKLPLISKQLSLRFVQDDELARQREKAVAAKKTHGISIPKVRGSETGSLLLGVIVIVLINIIIWQIEGFFTTLMVDFLFIFFGAAVILGERLPTLGRGLFFLGGALSVAAFGTVLFPRWLAVLIALPLMLYGLIFALGGSFQVLDRVVAWLSPLDDMTAVAALEKYNRLLEEYKFKTTYYGRVWEPNQSSRWQYVLQYWLFYAMNDWRTAHAGLDDHEGDWEMVQVCIPRDSHEKPTVVYAQHHIAHLHMLHTPRPIAYIAAGSHAAYPGCKRHPLSVFITSKKSLLSFASLFTLLVNAAERFVRKLPEAGAQVVKTYQEEGRKAGLEPITQASERLSIIVDRATGGLRVIGPGGEKWAQELLNEEIPWVSFKGRWGRSVLYPPESGPGGPRFHRDGKERVAWRDPLGWAGLPR